MQAPSGLKYTTPVIYSAGAAAQNVPTYGGGAPTSWSVTPTLPAGLSLNTSSGSIAGVPSTAAAATSYHVTASNSAGSTSADVVITVVDTRKTLTLVVTFSGPATVGVTSSPAGLSTAGAGTVSAKFAAGTAVTLTLSNVSTMVAGWTGGSAGACSGSASTCTVTLNSDLTQNLVVSAYNEMFITSGTYTGNLGGLAGADALCNAAALDAGVPGHFRAWLSDSKTNAVDRFAAVGTGGWQRVDGSPFAPSLSGLLGGLIYYPPNLTEQNTVMASSAFTGTDPNGKVVAGANCSDWTSETGAALTGGPTGAAELWTSQNNYLPCMFSAALYCLGTDVTRPVPAPVPPADARRAFVSSGGLSGALGYAGRSGLPGADTLCQAEASAAGLPNPGAFQALLATSQATGPSRFDLGKGTWVRVDGTSLAATAAEFAANHMLAALDERADGTVVHPSAPLSQPWIGSGAAFQHSAAGESCGDWLDGSSSATGVVAFPSWSQLYQAGNKAACDQALPVVCLENVPSSTYVLSINTVNSAGAGGTVSGSCGSNCTASYAAGTLVTLTATPNSGSKFYGWSGDCSGAGPCTLKMDRAHLVSAAFTQNQPNFIFVTSADYGPAITGLAAADAVCMASAADAGLPGNYKAWLSTSKVNARDRFPGANGWVRPDGLPFARSMAELVDGGALYSPLVDEHGQRRPWVYVRTGTAANGTAASTCSDYSDPNAQVTAGAALGGVGSWSVAGTTGCSSALALYCLGTDHDSMLTVPDAGTRYAFVTTNTWTPGGGLASADALCAAEAADAGLAGSYAASLSTSTTSNYGRFDLGKPMWVKPNGVPLASSMNALTSDQMNWDSMPDLRARGGPGGGGYVWGAPSTQGGTTPTAFCGDWTSASSSLSTSSWSAATVGYGQSTCNDTFEHLFCLQK